MTHTLNKAKVEEELRKRGWTKGLHKEWVAPPYGSVNEEDDWTECILLGIECSLEQSQQETKEFLKKHPTKKR